MNIFTHFRNPRIYFVRSIVGVALLTICVYANGQTTGDYRSALGFFETGSWDDLADWERWDGAAWVAPGANGYPGQNSVPGTVTIISLDIMQLNVSPANNIGNLVIADLSSLTVSGNRTLTINNDLDLGLSIFTFSGTGNLTVSGTSQIDGLFTDNDNTGVSTFVGLVTNTGTWTTTAVTTTGNLVLRGGITNSGTFNAGGATFNTNDQILSGSGTMTFANTVTVTGVTVTNNRTISMTNTAAATLTGVGGTWTQGINSTLNYTGSTITTLTFNASNIGNTVNYNSAAGAQTIFNSSASTYYHLALSGAGNQTKTLSANTIVNGNLSIQNTAIFSVSTFSLSVAGIWSNSSTNADPFVQGTQTVTLNGTSAQTINNTGDADGTGFNSLTIANGFASSPQITTNANVTVGGTMTMSSGNVNLNTTTFVIGTGTTVATIGTLTYTGGWMYGGNLTRFFNAGTAVTLGTTNGLYPLGSSSDYRPLYLGKNTAANTGGSLTVSHTGTDNTTSGVTIVDDNGTITLRHNSFWTVTKTSGMNGAGTPYGIQAGGTGFGTIGSVDDLRLCQLAAEVGTTSLPNGGNTTSPLVNKISISNALLARNYYVGSVDAINSPLPIELINFSAAVKNDIVELEWSTASELNNDFFTIERASDIEKFEPVGEFIGGKGTTRERNDYYTRDENPLYGRSYYRLKQTDFDGAFTYSPIEVVDYEGPRFSTLKAYPNPSNGHSLTLVVIGLKEQTSVPLQIYNVQGQKVYEHLLEVSTSGTLKHDVEFGTPLKQGLYIIKAGQTLQLTQKIIVD